MKTHRVDPEKNASQPKGQTDRWTDERDWFFYKDGGLIMLFGNSRIKFS